MNNVRPLLNRLFPLDHYTDPIQRWRAVGTYIVGALALVSAVLAGITLVGQIAAGQATLNAVALVRGIVLILVSFGMIWFTRRGNSMLGALIIIVLWFAFAFYTQFTSGREALYAFPTILLGLSLSAALAGESVVLPTTALSILALIVGDLVNPNLPSELGPRTLPTFLGIVVVYAALNYIFARSIRVVGRSMQETVERQRIGMAEATSAISRRLLASRLDLEALLREAVSVVKDTFKQVDQAQLFLVDNERQNASLMATTYMPLSGESGLGQQIGVGSLSVIGRVTVGGQPILVGESGNEQPQRRSAFLPGTKSELALPLIAGQQAIGVLDLQSQAGNAFSVEDIELFTTIANQIAAAIDSARLYTEAQTRLTENQRLYDQTRASLREIERLNQQLTGTAWTEYLRSQPVIPAFSIDLASGQVENSAEWTPTLAEASRRKQVLVRQADNAKIVSLPITVRGQVIGAMEFEIAPDQTVGAEQITILQQVVERLGLAAENARLFEQTQRAAQREAIVNEISTRMQATTNIEAVIAAATQSLADVFQSSRVAIRLGTPTNGTQ